MIKKIEGDIIIGLRQTIKNIKKNKGKCLYVARDADTKFVDPIIELASEKSLKIVFIDTMTELGTMCSIDVGASVALVLG